MAKTSAHQAPKLSIPLKPNMSSNGKVIPSIMGTPTSKGKN